MSEFENNQIPQAPAEPQAPVAPQPAVNLPQANQGNPVDQAKDVAQKVLKNPNLPKIAIGVVAAIVVIVILSALLGKGYEKPLGKYYDSKYKGKLTESKLEDMLPEEAWALLGENLEELDIDDDVAEVRANAVENYLAYYEDEMTDSYGEFDKYDYEIKKAKELSDKKVEEIAEYLNDEYDIDEDSVKKVYKLTLDGEIIFEDDEIDVDDVVYYSVKIGGDWYLLTSGYSFVGENFITYYEAE